VLLTSVLKIFGADEGLVELPRFHFQAACAESDGVAGWPASPLPYLQS